MELKLETQEVKNILLEWAEKEFPGAFNTVNIDISYSSLRDVTFSKTEPAKVEA